MRRILSTRIPPGRRHRRKILRWLLFGVLASLAPSSCKKPVPSARQRQREKQEALFQGNPAQKGRSQAPLPIEKVLIDNQGRELDARIIGKNMTHLTVIRKADGERFEVAIASLSVEARDYVAGLMVQAPPPIDPGETENAVDPEIERWTKKIDRIEDEIRELGEALGDSKLGQNSPRRKGLQAEIGRLRDEKEEVEKWLREAEEKADRKANSR